jgi:iron-sulfur cluster repair protein YtfE (RIC family)
MNTSTIHADLRVNDIIREHPGTVGVFARWEIDSCCGGARTLQEVAERHALPLEELLAELEAAAKSG